MLINNIKKCIKHRYKCLNNKKDKTSDLLNDIRNKLLIKQSIMSQNKIKLNNNKTRKKKAEYGTQSDSKFESQYDISDSDIFIKPLPLFDLLFDLTP